MSSCVSVVAPHVVLVGGDIPAESLGPFISKGIETALESAHWNSSMHAESDVKAKCARKDLHALLHDGISYSMLDYAPAVFAQVRHTFGISDSAYLDSLVRQGVHGGSVGDGKSGMLFFYSNDGKYVIKTVKKAELKFFRSILAKYTEHVCEKNKHTLLPRFFSMHKIMYTTRASPGGMDSALSAPASRSNGSSNLSGGGAAASGSSSAGGERRTFRLIVMNNLFDVPPSIFVSHRFDLKGSTRHRRVAADQIKPGRVLLDLNFEAQGWKIRLGAAQKLVLMQQLRLDCAFLREQNIMDHSLLLGIHEDAEEEMGAESTSAARAVDAHALGGPLLPDQSEPEWHPPGGGLVSVWQAHRGGVRAFESINGAPPHPRKEIYFIGIIDILQEFNTVRRLCTRASRERTRLHFVLCG